MIVQAISFCFLHIKVSVGGTPIDRAIFDEKLYPIIYVDLSNVERKMFIIRETTSNMISVVWEQLEKQFKRQY